MVTSMAICNSQGAAQSGRQRSSRHTEREHGYSAVQNSCLITLNNLLSNTDHLTTRWQPIVPDRRHSAPVAPSVSAPASSSTLQPLAHSALHTIVQNLRNGSQDQEAEVVAASTDDASLLFELRERVDVIAPTLEEHDAPFAAAIVALLTDLQRLADSHPHSQSLDLPSSPSHFIPSSDAMADFRRHLSDLQARRTSSTVSQQTQTAASYAPQGAALWECIDRDMEAVAALCKTRSDSMAPPQPHPSHEHEHLPPHYDDTYDAFETPPEYYAGDTYTRASYDSTSDKKSLATPHSPTHSVSMSSVIANEKMRLDFDTMARAIDRLYSVAPQLHNQRVELKRAKLDEMENARRAGAEGREPEELELDRMLDLLGKASARKMADQTVVMDGARKVRIESAQKQYQKERNAFVEHVMSKSGAGRLHGQDAVRAPTKMQVEQGADVAISLPEFLREPMPAATRTMGRAVSGSGSGAGTWSGSGSPLTREKEAARKGSPPVLANTGASASAGASGSGWTVGGGHGHSRLRSRSMSAPSMAWLRPSSRSGKRTPKNGSRPTSARGLMPDEARAPPAALDVSFIAEYHETLKHILIFVSVSNIPPGSPIEAEVLPCTPDSATATTSWLVVRSGTASSPPLPLPVRVPPSRPVVSVSEHHFELKLSVPSGSGSGSGPGSGSGAGAGQGFAEHDDPPALMSASHLSRAKPTSFACASCSLPLVHPPPPASGSTPNSTTGGGGGGGGGGGQGGIAYRDLPSEHWEELVDAWMCHADQTLNEQVARTGRDGFWPTGPGVALVGGSYVLFHGGVVACGNLAAGDLEPKGDDDRRLVRCLCGAVVGRVHDRHTADGSSERMFRLYKYAIRPITPSAGLTKVPLSAFVLEDMLEHVRAHATYRFVLFDEEEERPRMLVWLFKPRIRLSYMLPTPYFLRKSGAIDASKVLYKILGPAEPAVELTELLNRYPGFPQAEHLYYPLGVCRKLAGLLSESKHSYPQSMRSMTGLDVGWLHRA
ncbi:hypothetical protein CONPUDRAFT_138644 [Coniophora puteana RWD-64-598 SS2]|uniref:Uncharacterized protein n=1 Tax=Coniophora puteana (strain RWD-64-598) TaxID=741705 RepID=A0A5M3MGF0_CONPW|nr:uncharacterized protein CONPUDRAFT_138644 [Coniophora puteana RWD-64-598 SS2]EIW78318.1 hypothetical protein CONPUDRAFT_138644 [Coniophora puteana RWD-64-598 SS2]